jgi:hypothetical protein
MADHQDAILRLCQFNELQRVFGVRRERLLDQNVKTLLEASFHDLEVSLWRSAHDNSIQTEIKEPAVINGEVPDVGMADSKVLELGRIPICDGAHRSPRDLDESADEVWTPVAASNHPHVQARQSNRLPSSKAR